MKQPNILLIMCDQLRFDWISCSGTGFVNTPNIDSIASRGVMFTRAVCNSPLCAPSRAALAAGIYPHRTGVLDNYVNFPVDCPTYYQALRRSGYRVGVIGKTDLHKPEHFYGKNGDRPFMYQLGFTDIIDTEGKMNAAKFGKVEYDSGDGEELVGPYQRYLKEKGTLNEFSLNYKERFKDKPLWYSEESILCKEDYHDGYIGKEACRYLEDVSEESPWHLFVSFVGPHDPWDSPKEYLELFNDKTFGVSIEDDMENKPEWIKKKSKNHSGNMKPSDLNRVKQHYAGMIKHLDDWVGKILNVLKKRDLYDETVIIFTADHGEMMGDHGLFQKNVMYHSAIRVPLIISHRDCKAGIKSDVLTELVDLYPTILDMAGVGYDGGRLDGKSLMPVISGESGHHKEYQISQLFNTRMIFDGRYKFIENYNDLSELYDLEEDPAELKNIAKDEPLKVRELLFKLREICK